MNQKKKKEEMYESKKTLFNFAQIGIQISNAGSNSTEGYNPVVPDPVPQLPQLEYEQIYEADSSIYHVQEDDGDEQTERLLSSEETDSENDSILLSLGDLSTFNQPDVVKDARKTFALQHTDV